MDMETGEIFIDDGMKISDLKLVLTSCACPEQYDVFFNKTQVGYLRLRHGCFTVEVPDFGGEYVYSANPSGDGQFEDYEREFYINQALWAICENFNKKENFGN